MRKTAAEDVLIAKIEWAKELGRVQELKREKQRLQLFEDFDVRLLGVDSGLKVLMDTPVEEWEGVRKRQQEIQGTLGASFDPTTATPRKVFATRPDNENDTDERGPYVRAIVVTEDDKLVMVDCHNSMVKVADLKTPNTVLGVRVDTELYRLAPLPDGGLVVVTSFHSTFLYLVDVSGHPSVVSRILTSREYQSVSAGVEKDTLIVGCSKDDDGPASVDVITRGGDVIMTVISNDVMKELRDPEYVCVLGGDVLISDSGDDTVFRVELATGRVLAKLTHPDMTDPRQVAVDGSGNIYIACGANGNVMAVSAAGKWRRLLEGTQHGDGTRDKARGVCVTKSGLVVTWCEFSGYSVMVGYDLF
nr:hypothetical protein BaRGS_028018 [Batillaria attramentaria]